jgi:hypothetical protein
MNLEQQFQHYIWTTTKNFKGLYLTQILLMLLFYQLKLIQVIQLKLMQIIPKNLQQFGHGFLVFLL